VPLSFRSSVHDQQVFVADRVSPVGGGNLVAILAHQYFAAKIGRQAETAAALAGLAVAFTKPLSQDETIRRPGNGLRLPGRGYSENEYEGHGRNAQFPVNHCFPFRQGLKPQLDHKSARRTSMVRSPSLLRNAAASEKKTVDFHSAPGYRREMQFASQHRSC